ncbi:Dynein assembly factor 4, axonemal [Phlyctochytrium bullatum]|nr:Dynein assembly factor 4, axonemal [Phlyctochytrium bullatum]
MKISLVPRHDDVLRHADQTDNSEHKLSVEAEFPLARFESLDLFKAPEKFRHKENELETPSLIKPVQNSVETLFDEHVTDPVAENAGRYSNGNIQDFSSDSESDDDDIDMDAILARVKHQMNRKWKLRVRRHREEDAKKRLSAGESDILEDERNQKGNVFLKNGNYSSALHAFTAAINIDDTMPSVYANRSLCYFAMQQFQPCIEDCSQAIALILAGEIGEDLSEKQTSALLKALYARRGAAFFSTENMNKALDDYNKAQELDPENSGLKHDIEVIRERVGSCAA